MRAATLAAMGDLSAGQPGTTSGGAPKKHSSRQLSYSLLWTVHAATGKTGTNLLLKFSIHTWDKDKIKDLLDGLPVDGVWYDKKEKVNMCKVSMPQLAEKIIAKVKAACPDSAANMSGNLSAPSGYVAPIVRLVVVPDLFINGELCGKPTLFFVGKMFPLKDCLTRSSSASATATSSTRTSASRPGTSTSPTASRTPSPPGSRTWYGRRSSTTLGRTRTRTSASEPPPHPQTGVF